MPLPVLAYCPHCEAVTCWIPNPKCVFDLLCENNDETHFTLLARCTKRYCFTSELECEHCHNDDGIMLFAGLDFICTCCADTYIVPLKYIHARNAIMSHLCR